MSKIKFYNCDCIEFMECCHSKKYDLAIVDPPYRDENQPTKDMRKNVKGDMDKFGNKPNNKYFETLFRISKNQIIWGANNFSLPCYKGFVVWEKITISENFTMSMAEIAYISESLGTVSKIFKYAPQGTLTDLRIHPTQKPIELYRWLLKNYAKTGDKIFDSHGGSMSIACACHDMGFDLDVCELDKDYFKAGKKRFENYSAQGRLI